MTLQGVSLVSFLMKNEKTVILRSLWFSQKFEQLLIEKECRESLSDLPKSFTFNFKVGLSYN